MKNLWIDTDCGVDDSGAILIALNCPNVNVVGISCVGGNVSLENVERNVMRTLSVYGKTNIPVYGGCECGLLTEPIHATQIHGTDGLGDVDFESYGIENNMKSREENAIFALIDVLMKNDDIEILTLGPLTNLAHAIHIEPKIIPKIKSVTIMGGAEDLKGNVTKFAEFNFRADPEAAAMVFKYIPANKITLVSWTLTIKYVMKDENLKELFYSRDTVLGRWVNDIWQTAINYNGNKTYTADPLASFVACYDDTAITASERAKIDIILSGEKVAASVPTYNEDGVRIVTAIDFDHYLDVFRALIKYK